MTWRGILCGCLVSWASVSFAQTNVLRVDISSRGGTASSLTDNAVRAFARNVANLTRSSRNRMIQAGKVRTPFFMPTRVELTHSGATSRGATSSQIRGLSRAPGDITLQFDSTGSRAFPQSYRDFLQSVFDTAKPTMNAVFGSAALSGVVRVANFDADIGDRDAVAGGYYLPDNGSGQREIRFPVYSSNEAATLNFVHTVLLAYQGANPYVTDAFQEGLVRAATISVVRTAGATLSLDPTLIESALSSTYTVNGYYDWYNQRALGGSRFIAPNLRDVPITQGSYGGPYLARYRMSGSAWLKVLIEYPTFISQLNTYVQLQPSLVNDVPGLIAKGQQALNLLRASDPTVEGMSFAEWFKRQFILETQDTNGLKVMIQPTPIDSNLSGPDFGVFALEATYFERVSSGDEHLLSGRSYPIFWDFDFINRISPSAQDERMDIAGSYGSVAPNFPDQQGGQPYRVTVDLPVQDQMARVFLPAGAIATVANPVRRDFYGTVVGAPPTTGTTTRVILTTAGTLIADLPVTNGAFGALINTPTYRAARTVFASVIRRGAGGDTVLFTRVVNKDKGDLELDLRVGADQTLNVASFFPKGVSAFGLPIDPFASYAPDVVGVPANALLLARFDPSKARYSLYPDTEAIKYGDGFFIRAPVDLNLSVEGRTSLVPVGVALRPGWNLISTPINETVVTTKVSVVRTTGFPRTFAESLGEDLGSTFFGYIRGANDPFSGVPETGTFSAATAFDPGKAYFVRCLAPEGATLLFQPSAGDFRSVRSPVVGNMAAQRSVNLQSVSSVTVIPTWRAKITVSGLDRQTECYVGMSRTATRGFDPKLDSEIPPTSGGFQVTVVGDRGYYREVRANSSLENFTLQVDGLRAGVKYTIVVNTEVGYAPRINLHDKTTGQNAFFKRGGQMTFTARQSSEIFVLTVGGAA